MLRLSKKSLMSGALLMAFLSVLAAVNLICYEDYQTSLLPGFFLSDGLSDLKANSWSVPVEYDWNDDGKKDLLVGSRTYRKDGDTNQGYVLFYENRGTDAQPSFSVYSLVQSCTKTCASLKVAADG